MSNSKRKKNIKKNKNESVATIFFFFLKKDIFVWKSNTNPTI